MFTNSISSFNFEQDLRRIEKNIYFSINNLERFRRLSFKFFINEYILYFGAYIGSWASIQNKTNIW